MLAKRKSRKPGYPPDTTKVPPMIQATPKASAPAPEGPTSPSATTPPLEQIFRDRLREWLAKRNWSQKDLADRMHKTPARVSHLLSGERRPELSTLQELADALGIEPMHLLDRRSLFRQDVPE